MYFFAILCILIVIFHAYLPEMRRALKSRISRRNASDFSQYEIPAESTNAEFFAEMVNILKQEFPFYQKLSQNEKILFANRTYKIRVSKEFFGMEDLVLKARHETLISATLTQLTFGLSKYYDLPSFEMIQVYPSVFYSKLIENHAKGLTLGNGRIFLSWKDFESGHDDADDKLHLGLHEFAHAMMIEFDHFKYVPQWKKWTTMAADLMSELRMNDQHFFRQYGATNIHEFWAVTVETFFEQPREFRLNYPDFYDATAAMLNQDLCARMEIFEHI